MGIYNNHIEPRLVNIACGVKTIANQRQKVTPYAEGRVLEIGFGSGHNLPFYDRAKVSHLWALEPSAAMRSLSTRRVASAPFPIEMIDLPAEKIPLEADTVDTVLMTYTMCTIPDVIAALEGVRRVLRPGGVMLICEHGLAPDARVRRWQDRLNGVWGKVAGGCRLNRDITALLADTGFDTTDVQAAYMPKTPRFAGYTFWGAAKPR